MSSRTYPLIAWGSADAINGGSYSSVGTIGQTAGQTDPFGGTDAYLLDDNDAANTAGRFKQIANLAASGFFIVGIRKGTGLPFIRLLDVTATADRVGAYASAWGAGAPTLASYAGSPILTPVDFGTGWYGIVMPYSGVVPGNDNRLYLYPDYNNGTVTGSGTTYFWVRNVALLDLLGSPLTFPRPKDGYEADVAPSGLEDSASYGDEYPIIGRVSWVPTSARSFPVIVSGFDGANESAGVNCGVAAMLSAGWNKNTLRFAQDRSACTSYVDTYLRNPTKGWRPELEGNADRAFEMELVSQTAIPGF